jgi:hypothetical protein
VQYAPDRFSSRPTGKPDETPVYYSKLRREIEGGQGRWNAADVMRYLKAKGVKPEEIQWSRIEEFLKDKKTVTKDDLLAHLDENEVKVEEKIYGESEDQARIQNEIDSRLKEAAAIYMDVLNDLIDAGKIRDGYRLSAQSKIAALALARESGIPSVIEKLERRDALLDEVAELRDAREPGAPTKFENHTLPGGTRYRELLLKWRPQDEIGQEQYDFLGRTGDRLFHSAHFDEPNILAHIRFNERTGPNGERIFHIEEVQSDWHQKARDLRSKEIEAVAKREGISEKEAAKLVSEDFGYNTEGVPDAPFKKVWPELALKRAIRWAADNGFDKVTWTTGEQQAARYSQGFGIDSISWGPRHGAEKMVLFHKDGKRIWSGELTDENGTIYDDGNKFGGKKLSDVIGKEMAAKVLGAPTGTIDKADMRVGGEGMRGFYDAMLPNKVQDIVKKLDPSLKVGEATVDIEGTPTALHPPTHT